MPALACCVPLIMPITTTQLRCHDVNVVLPLQRAMRIFKSSLVVSLNPSASGQFFNNWTIGMYLLSVHFIPK